MKKPYLKFTILLVFLLSNSFFAQTTLKAGDIAIVGIQSDTPKQFSFVLLVDIQAGTKIYFTDSGVKSDGTFRANEGAILYTAPTNLSAGKLITYTDTAANFTSANDANVGTNGFNLSTAGDQIIAFAGATATPVFLFAITTFRDVFQATTSSSNDTGLPPGLTVGLNAVAVGKTAAEFDNSAYNLSVASGDKSTLLAAIANKSNWNGSDSAITFSAADFTVSGGSTPAATTVILKGNGQTIANNDTTPSTTDGTDFGTVAINTNLSKTFTVENNTGASVTITGLAITGTNATNFKLDGATPSFPIVLANGATQNFTLNFTASMPATYNATMAITTSTNTITFDVVATTEISSTSLTLIHNIQGSGTASPLSGTTVTIEGIVVGDFQEGSGTHGDLRGFFVQEEDTDVDANIQTSEGILIFDGASPAVNVAVGDKVRITGTVTEFFGVTEINALTSVLVLSTGNPLPTAATVNLPVANTTTNSVGAFIPDLEYLEGMLVSFPQTLTVSELFQLERYGEMRLAQGTRPTQFTQQSLPNTTNFNTHKQNLAKRTLILDDGRSVQNQNPIRFPDGNLDTSDALRMGNTIVNLTGVVNFSKGSGSNGDENYRILPTVNPVFNPINTRTNTPPTVGGSLKVAALNVLNYFKTINASGNITANGSTPRGANNTIEFNRQREKLITALKAMDADVLGLVELENDFSPSSSSNAIQDIVNGLNASLGSTIYNWVNPGTPFVGGDAIAVGIIYKTASVSIAPSTTVQILNDSKLPSLGISSSTAIFDGSGTNRVPLAVTFKQSANNEKFTVVVTHFKSKGSAGAAGTLDNDANDGAGFSNQTRLNGVTALEKWLATDPTNSNDTDFILLGDFNAYAQEAPIKYLESKGFKDLARNFLGNNAYSYVFDGQVGTLDYAFASNSLFSQVTGTIEWHINADEATAIDYNLDFSRSSSIFDGTKPFRISDHDPVIVGLDLKTTTLGVQGIDNEDAFIKVYPVPVNNTAELFIEGTSVSGTVTVSVYSVTGAELISKKIKVTKGSISTLNIEELASGIYYLVLENNGKRFSKSFVK